MRGLEIIISMVNGTEATIDSVNFTKCKAGIAGTCTITTDLTLTDISTTLNDVGRALGPGYSHSMDFNNNLTTDVECDGVTCSASLPPADTTVAGFGTTMAIDGTLDDIAFDETVTIGGTAFCGTTANLTAVYSVTHLNFTIAP